MSDIRDTHQVMLTLDSQKTIEKTGLVFQINPNYFKE